jgi:hypothetical protein
MGRCLTCFLLALVALLEYALLLVSESFGCCSSFLVAYELLLLVLLVDPPKNFGDSFYERV